jgi:predicted metalloprotease with PDZ domain
VRPVRPNQGWLGATRVKADGSAVTLDQIPAPTSPLYRAGVDRGDVLLTLDGKPLARMEDWAAAQIALKPGRAVRLTWRNRAGEQSATVTPVADPAFEIVRNESIGKKLTKKQQAFRESWLGTAK